MSELSLLKWDSEFFERKIGVFSLSKSMPENLISRNLELAKSLGYELIYVFDDFNSNISSSVLNRFNGDLVDIKVTFKKNIQERPTANKNISIYDDQTVTDSLLELSFLSGSFSRFKRDSRFSKNDFERLYRKWIEGSLNKELADATFVYTENNHIVGFITLVVKNETGHIGLIAVNPDFSGRKIGSALINKSCSYLLDNSIDTVHVPTQKENQTACKFYLKNGFELLSEQSIYHFSL